MPIGAANLFSATDPKLVVYDYATSFFGGVAPLVSSRNCCDSVVVVRADQVETCAQLDDLLIAPAFSCNLLGNSPFYVIVCDVNTADDVRTL